MKKNKREIIDHIKEVMKEGLRDCFIGQKKWDVRGQVKRALHRLVPDYKKYISYEIAQIDDREVTLKPKNIFTGLFFSGRGLVPEAIGKEEFETKEGKYTMENGTFCFKPKTPLSYITVDVELKQ